MTDGLARLAQQQPMFAYNFEGRRYDVGDKLGFLEAQVEFALKHGDLREPFLKYLKDMFGNK